MRNISKYILRIALIAAIFVMGEGVMWGSTYYSKVSASVNTESTGSGKVYSIYLEDNSYPGEDKFEKAVTYAEHDSQAGSAPTHQYYVRAAPDDGSHFVSWENVYNGDEAKPIAKVTVVANSTSGDSPATANPIALFEKNYYISVNAVSNDDSWGTVSARPIITDNTESESTELSYTLTNVPKQDYHFVGWEKTAGDNDGKISGNTFTGKTSANPGEYNNYTVKGTFERNVYYAKVDLSINGQGSATIDEGSSSTKSSTNSGEEQTFALSASSTVSGWHFAQWNKVSGDGSFEKNTDKNTTYKAKVASTGVHEAIAEYKIEAKFVENYYTAVSTAVSTDEGDGGSAYIAYGAGSTVGTDTSADDGDGQEYARDVYYQVKAVEKQGYHFTGWTISGDGVVEHPESLESKITVKSVNNKQGPSNKNTYTVTANFAKDRFNAKLTVAASQAGTGTKTGVAKVHNGMDFVTDPVVKSASTSGGEVTFDIQATPNTGYQLLGWATSDNSTDYVTITDNKYTVNGHTTEGQTLEYSLFAVFGHGKYTVKFDGNGAASGSMVDEEFTHGTPQKLTKLGYVNDFTLTFNTQGGNQIDPVTQPRFNGWSYDDNAYSDEQEIDLTVEHGSELEFKATWAESLEFELPTPVKTAEDGSKYTFHGWYDSAIGGNKVGDGGETVNIDATKTLYAHWQQYNIVVKANDGQEETGDKAVFNVVRAGTPATSYRISVPIGGSASSRTLSDVAPGEWTVTPVGIWSWKYSTPDAQTKESLSDETTTFEFVFTPKESVKINDETSKTKDYTKSN